MHLWPCCYISDAVRFRKLIRGTDIGWGCRAAAAKCDHDLTFYLAIVTFCLSYILETVRCRNLILYGLLIGGCRCAMPWCNMYLTFDLAVVTLTFKIMFRQYLGNHKSRKVMCSRDIALVGGAGVQSHCLT